MIKLNKKQKTKKLYETVFRLPFFSLCLKGIDIIFFFQCTWD